MIIINSALLLLLLLFIIIKTIHFRSAINSKHRKLINWLYFNHNDIVRSQSDKSVLAKKKQNVFSVGIGFLLLVIVFAFIFEFSVLIQPLPNTAQPSAPKQPSAQPKRQTD